MKNAILMLAFFLAVGITTASAQSCHASATATKSCCTAKASTAAAADPTIEKRQAEDGTLSFVRKEADQQGNVRFVSVRFDEAQNAFVNAAPPAAAATEAAKVGMTKKEACAAGGKKACCAGGAKTTSTAAKVEQK